MKSALSSMTRPSSAHRRARRRSRGTVWCWLRRPRPRQRGGAVPRLRPQVGAAIPSHALRAAPFPQRSVPYPRPGGQPRIYSTVARLQCVGQHDDEHLPERHRMDRQRRDIRRQGPGHSLAAGAAPRVLRVRSPVTRPHCIRQRLCSSSRSQASTSCRPLNQRQDRPSWGRCFIARVRCPKLVCQDSDGQILVALQLSFADRRMRDLLLRQPLHVAIEQQLVDGLVAPASRLSERGRRFDAVDEQRIAVLRPS